MTKFIASHGVAFADLDITFKYDAEATGNGSARVYSFEATAAQAKALKALPKDELSQYGIKAVSSDDDA